PEDAVDIGHGLPILVENVETVIDQAALGGAGRYAIDRRQPMARGEVDRQLAVGQDEGVGIEDHAALGLEPRQDRLTSASARAGAVTVCTPRVAAAASIDL